MLLTVTGGRKIIDDSDEEEEVKPKFVLSRNYCFHACGLYHHFRPKKTEQAKSKTSKLKFVDSTVA